MAIANRIAVRELPRPLNLTRLYRAYVEPSRDGGADRMAFIEADSQPEAHERIAQAVAAMECDSVQSVRNRIHNCSSARECVNDGLSATPAWRLFETAWGSGKVKAWALEPLFLLAAPSHLTRIWAQLPKL